MGTAELAAYALRLAAVLHILGGVWLSRSSEEMAARLRRLTQA